MKHPQEHAAVVIDDETRAEFHARRAKGIGGSDVAPLLGLSTYKTPEQLWMEKTGQAPPDDTDSPDAERGRTFEHIALHRYATKSGNSITRTKQRGSHPSYPWMLYEFDGIAIIDGDEAIIEVKCPSLGKWSTIMREGLPDAWRIQMQHYLLCSEMPRGVFALFCADRMQDVSFVVEADPLIHEMLIEKEREFWTLVETMTPPANIVAEVRGQEIVVVGEVEKRRDDEFVEAMKLMKEAKALSKTAEDVEEEAKARIIEVIGENRRGIFEAEGIGRVHYKDRTRAGSFDHKALLNARPLDRLAVMANITELLKGVMHEEWQPQFLSHVVSNSDLDLSKFFKPETTYTELRPYFGKGE